MTILDASKVDAFAGGASYQLSHRLYRIVWTVAWMLLASWTPPQLRAWRRALLRAFGAKVAPTANIYGTAKIWSPANLEIHDYACIARGANIYSMAKVTMGTYSLVSQGAYVCAGTHDIEDPHFQLQAFPITIGARAWIAADAFVGPGVTVGEGAVLGARGCAFKALEPWTVYGGNPARPLKSRRIRFGRTEERAEAESK